MTLARMAQRSQPWADGVAGRTPQALFDLGGLERRLQQCAAGAAARGITLAYSIKTNPMPAILRRVCTAGMAAEAISGAEAEAAFKAGFTADRVVLGGVAKAWPTGTVTPGLLAILDDTVEGFMQGVHAGAGHRHHCMRLRFPGVASRLGFDTADLGQRHVLADALLSAQATGASVGLATHEHSVPASGADAWLNTVRLMIDGLEEARPGILASLECIDLGGGYDADCLDDLLLGDLGKSLLGYLNTRLPRCRAIILEPGKSLVQAHGVIVGSVIGRVAPGEVSVDASMAELPWPMSDRPVFVWRDGVWRDLGPGTGMVTGRCTAETDVLATSVDISGLTNGDRLLFGEAGAYDWSMRNTFGAAEVIETVAE